MPPPHHHHTPRSTQPADACCSSNAALRMPQRMPLAWERPVRHASVLSSPCAACMYTHHDAGCSCWCASSASRPSCMLHCTCLLERLPWRRPHGSSPLPQLCLTRTLQSLAPVGLHTHRHRRCRRIMHRGPALDADCGVGPGSAHRGTHIHPSLKLRDQAPCRPADGHVWAGRIGGVRANICSPSLPPS